MALPGTGLRFNDLSPVSRTRTQQRALMATEKKNSRLDRQRREERRQSDSRPVFLFLGHP